MKDLSSFKDTWKEERNIRDEQYEELQKSQRQRDLKTLELQDTIATLQEKNEILENKLHNANNKLSVTTNDVRQYFLYLT